MIAPAVSSFHRLSYETRQHPQSSDLEYLGKICAVPAVLKDDPNVDN
jgi:hypothetical protein